MWTYLTLKCTDEWLVTIDAELCTFHFLLDDACGSIQRCPPQTIDILQTNESVASKTKACRRQGRG